MVLKADFANRTRCRIHQNDRVFPSNFCVFKHLPPRTAISDLRRISGFNLGQILDTVTFDQIPNYSGGSPNTFQYYFDDTGLVELRYGACDPSSALVGWSPGTSNANPGSIDISATPVILWK